MCQFSGKADNSKFFGPNFSKNGIGVGNSENQFRNKNQHPRDTLCANVWAKQTTLNFSTQIFLKMNLGLKIRRTNNGIKINVPIFKLCANFQVKGTFFTFSVEICPKIGLRAGIPKTYIRIRNQHLQDIIYVIFSSKRETLSFLPKFGVITKHMQYFDSNNIKGVQKAEWRLKSAGWNWVEMVGGGWNWLEV